MVGRGSGGGLGYVAALDGVRAVAVCLVVSFHAFRWPLGGPLGVDVFLVLSGFLITTLLTEERQRTGRVDLPGFYLRRARRLMPASLLLILAVSVVWDIEQRSAFPAVFGLTYTTNVATAYTHARIGALQHLWSLAMEEQFYLLWPFALFVVIRGRRRAALLLLAAVALAAVVAQLAGSSLAAVEFGPLSRSTGLAVGCAAALLPRRSVTRGLPFAIVTVAVFSLLGYVTVLADGLLTVFCVACAVVILGVLEPNRVSRALAAGPFVWLGTRSYSLYLWHYPILVALRANAAVSGRPATVRVLGVCLSLAAAELSYRCVETPFRRRRLAGHHDQPAASLQVS